MKDTALTNTHLLLGAKMISFAGYRMPVQYEGISIEHESVRNAVGVFDVSHMGEFCLKGEKSLALIQKITSNDAAKLTDGMAQYSCFPSDKGGIVDDLIVYRIQWDEYMLVVNASNIEKDEHWIAKYNDFGVEVRNVSDQVSLLAVQGPKAVEALQPLTTVNLSAMKYYTFEIGTLAGIKDVLISATGYTGSGGFELYVKNEDAKNLWDAVFNAGAAFNIRPAGLAARDTLRMEMGYCLYGNDIDGTTSPIEAGLGWITKFSKRFINDETLKKQKEQGITRKLVAFEMEGKGIPRQGYSILDTNGTVIGNVTSGTMSPSLKKGIGLGYVSTSYSKTGSPVSIQIREKTVPATIVKPPFYKKRVESQH